MDQFIDTDKATKSDIIEVHNRPNYIKQLKNKLNAKITLYFHNDPLNMNGSMTVKVVGDLTKKGQTPVIGK